MKIILLGVALGLMMLSGAMFHDGINGWGTLTAMLGVGLAFVQFSSDA